MWTAFVDFLAYVLSSLTAWTGNLGIAIILFTILTRLAMLPLTIKQLQSSKKLQELQPLMAELRRKYGRDQQRLAEEMTKLYREYRVNPAGSCLPLLIQLPIFLGVYQAVIKIVQDASITINQKIFLGINLGLATFQPANEFTQNLPGFQPGFQGWPYLILPVLSVLLQLMVTLMAQPKIQDPQQKAISQALLFMPILFGYIGFTFNQGAVLYWVAGSVWAVIQQYFVTGFGALTNIFPFLPERKGFLTPSAPAPALAEAAPEADNEPKADFWAPLSKLRAPAGAAPAGDSATEQAIAEVKRQTGKKRR